MTDEIKPKMEDGEPVCSGQECYRYGIGNTSEPQNSDCFKSGGPCVRSLRQQRDAMEQLLGASRQAGKAMQKQRDEAIATSDARKAQLEVAQEYATGMEDAARQAKAERDALKKEVERLKNAPKFGNFTEEMEHLLAGNAGLMEELGQAKAEVERLTAIMVELTDEDPCHYDHHEYCQTHSLHERPCPHETAKSLLNGSSDEKSSCTPRTALQWRTGEPPLDEVRIKEGWQGAGAVVEVIGQPVFFGQWWVPIVDDEDDDPTFFKLAGLEMKAPDLLPHIKPAEGGE